MKTNYKLGKMTIRQKIDACIGASALTTAEIPFFDAEAVRLAFAQNGVNTSSVPLVSAGAQKNVVYPSAMALGASFDTHLATKIGESLAEDAHDSGVDTLIVAGAHPIRNPFNGTNPNYYSEDPMLSALLASALIAGINSRGNGVIVDGYGADDAQNRRLHRNSIIDERTFNELYACGFDYILKVNKPMGVMLGCCRLNGEKLSESRTETDKIRLRTGFNGAFFSLPYSDTDPAAAISAGNMPELTAKPEEFAKALEAAVHSGRISEAQLDDTLLSLVEFSRAAAKNRRVPFMHDSEVNHSVAVAAARECFVLLKNEADTLPLLRETNIAVTGKNAIAPVIQVPGRYYVSPTRVCAPMEQINKLCQNAYYAKDCMDADFTPEALNAASTVIMFAGSNTPEGEGLDKSSLALPEAQLALMKKVKALGKRLVLVLSGGVYEMSGTEIADAIIYDPLCGQGGAEALAEIIFGIISPSGRLPVSLPKRVEDIPTYKYYSAGANDIVYQESLFLGYRYYSATSEPAAYPFGSGLTYSSFLYSELAYTGMQRDGKVKVSFKLTNTGGCEAAEVVQAYVSDIDRRAYKARRDLKYFERVNLAPGESKIVSFTLTHRDFSYYDTRTHAYEYYAGKYAVQIGASAVDIHLNAPLTLCANAPYTPQFGEKDIPSFLRLHSGKMTLANNEYKLLYSRALPLSEQASGIGEKSPLRELATLRRGEKLLDSIDAQLGLYAPKRLRKGEIPSAPDALAVYLRAVMLDLPVSAFMRYHGEMIDYSIIKRSKPLLALLGEPTVPEKK